MEFDYSRLRGKIREKCGTETTFARAMGLSITSMSKKLNAKTMFTQDEMFLACSILGVDVGDIPLYFFAPKAKQGLAI